MSSSSTLSLHLEGYITALRVLAVAGKFGCLLRIGTCIAAVILSGAAVHLQTGCSHFFLVVMKAPFA